MIARISTYLPCSEEELWTKIVDPKSLQFVVSPVLSFIPVGKNGFEKEWEIDRDYNLKLYFFGFIPLGRHQIRLVEIDRSQNKIVSSESGLLAHVWKHTIQFEQSGNNKVLYTDLIEIKAGLLTLLIWCFAHFFYRHRQRRWIRLIERS